MPNFANPRGLSRRIRLTPTIIAREIRAARATAEQITITDTASPGLRLIIGARSATWSVTARPRGLDADGNRYPLKSVTIGDATSVDIDAARKAAAAIKRDIALGRDPVAERRERYHQEALAARSTADKAKADAEMLRHILDPQSGTTTRKAAAIFDFTVLSGAILSDSAMAFALHGVTGSRGYVYRTIRNLHHALIEMGAANLRPHELKKQHVRALAELHVKAGRQATARHRHGALHRFYRWMQSVDAIENSPVTTITAPLPPAPRTNVPSARAVQAIWDAAERLPAPRAAFVRLALLTPLRRQELANLKVGNIVLDGHDYEIRLLSNQTKNKKPFTMPLTGAAAAIVRDLLAATSSPDDLLIPLTRHGAVFSNWGRLSEQLAREAGLHFRLHDTRRLFASEMAEHGIANFGTIDGLLNHQRSASLGGVARAYHHAAEKAARRSAMAEWDRILLHAARYGLWPRQMPATDANVVPLASNRFSRP